MTGGTQPTLRQRGPAVVACVGSVNRHPYCTPHFLLFTSSNPSECTVSTRKCVSSRLVSAAVAVLVLVIGWCLRWPWANKFELTDLFPVRYISSSNFPLYISKHTLPICRMIVLHFVALPRAHRRKTDTRWQSATVAYRCTVPVQLGFNRFNFPHLFYSSRGGRCLMN